MVHHIWGDGFPYFKDVEEAADYIGNHCAFWGRMGGQTKEKWGNCIYYHMFGLSLHSLIFPKHMYNQLPKWLWVADLNFITPFLNKLIGKPWSVWQKKVYSDAYLKAIKKYPHIRAEILCGADSPELIKGICWQEKIDDTWHLRIRGANGETIGGWQSSSPWKEIK